MTGRVRGHLQLRDRALPDTVTGETEDTPATTGHALHRKYPVSSDCIFVFALGDIV